MTSSSLSPADFAKMAAALMGQAKGEPPPQGIDLSDRKQLLAFAEALIKGDDNASSTCSEEESVPPEEVDEVDEDSDELEVPPPPPKAQQAAQEIRRT